MTKTAKKTTCFAFDLLLIESRDLKNLCFTKILNLYNYLNKWKFDVKLQELLSKREEGTFVFVQRMQLQRVDSIE